MQIRNYEEILIEIFTQIVNLELNKDLLTKIIEFQPMIIKQAKNNPAVGFTWAVSVNYLRTELKLEDNYSHQVTNLIQEFGAQNPLKFMKPSASVASWLDKFASLCPPEMDISTIFGDPVDFLNLYINSLEEHTIEDYWRSSVDISLDEPSECVLSKIVSRLTGLLPADLVGGELFVNLLTKLIIDKNSATSIDNLLFQLPSASEALTIDPFTQTVELKNLQADGANVYFTLFERPLGGNSGYQKIKPESRGELLYDIKESSPIMRWDDQNFCLMTMANQCLYLISSQRSNSKALFAFINAVLKLVKKIGEYSGEVKLESNRLLAAFTKNCLIFTETKRKEIHVCEFLKTCVELLDFDDPKVFQHISKVCLSEQRGGSFDITKSLQGLNFKNSL